MPKSMAVWRMKNHWKRRSRAVSVISATLRGTKKKFFSCCKKRFLEKEKENIANKKQPSSSEVMVLSLRRR